MPTNLSTGLRNKLMGTAASHEALKQILDGGVIGLYGGASIPANADAIETGTLLCWITLDGGAFTPDGGGGSTNGLTFEDAVAGVLNKATAEVWKGTAEDTGTVQYARFYDRYQETGASSTAVRMDMTVGVTPSPVKLSTTALENGVTEVKCTVCRFTLPATLN